jgi:hypothetical protein
LDGSQELFRLETTHSDVKVRGQLDFSKLVYFSLSVAFRVYSDELIIVNAILLPIRVLAIEVSPDA